MTKHQFTNPTEEDYALVEASIENVAVDVSASLRLRMAPGDGRGTQTNLSIRGEGEHFYMEVEDATLLLRFDDGTPFMRFAVVNGFLTQDWTLASAEELQAQIDLFRERREGEDDD